MKIREFLILILFVAALAGCGSIQPTTQGSNAAEPAATATVAPPTVTLTPVPSPTPNADKSEDVKMTPSASGMQSFIDQAIEDLAQRLSVPTEKITLVKTSEVVWPDASLGCPQPGMAYKQVPQDGALIILEVEGTTYEYHTGGNRGVFLCETPPAKTEKPPQIDLTKLTPQSSTGKNPTPPPVPDNSIPPGEDQ